MNDVTRALLVLLVIGIIFGLSFLAFDHVDDSYRHNEPVYILELKAENDSLKVVRNNLQEKLDELEAASDEANEADEGDQNE